MARVPLKLTQMCTGVLFYHEADERAFFEWLERIPCVSSVKGEGADGLVVRLERPPDDDDLRQLIAFCHRYRVDMRQLARFETPENRAWFRKRSMFWHRKVFGDGSRT